MESRKKKNLELKLLESSLNLRVERGRSHTDYRLRGDVAKAQLQFSPDVIVNVEDMECDSSEYDALLLRDSYQKIAATEDRQCRGNSCWVKKEYAVKKICSMVDPHFLHVHISKGDQYINLLIVRILVAASDDEDFKNRRVQWERVLRYIDELEDKSNLVLTGDLNHGVIAKSYSDQHARRFFNYQQVASDLQERGIPIIPMSGWSFRGYMKIDHLATTNAINVRNARYEKVFQGSYEIGIPDHSFIVADLQLCE